MRVFTKEDTKTENARAKVIQFTMMVHIIMGPSIKIYFTAKERFFLKLLNRNSLDSGNQVKEMDMERRIIQMEVIIMVNTRMICNTGAENYIKRTQALMSVNSKMIYNMVRVYIPGLMVHIIKEIIKMIYRKVMENI